MKKILIFTIFTGLVFSQTDKMYIGDVKKKTKVVSGKKIKIIEKVPFRDAYIIYGKYNGANWETGEIDFIGNDGTLYTNPSNVQTIKNHADQEYIIQSMMEGLRWKRKELARKNLQALCEQNKSITVMVFPFNNDFYGLTEDVEHTMATEGCYNVLPNEKGMEYVHNNNLSPQNLNDFILRNLGESIGVDYIIYGFADEYNVPFKYAGTSSNQSIQRVSYFSNENWMNELLISLNNWAVVGSEMRMRSNAALESGAYITLTYYSINVSNGNKKFLTKNKTVLKKG